MERGANSIDERSPSSDADSDEDSPSSDADRDDESQHRPENLPEGPRTAESGRREVVVPNRLYKTVTVFSTLLAIVCVVAGFWFLTAAGAVIENPTGSLFVALIQMLGGLTVSQIEPYVPVIALMLGLTGLALVAGGGWVFAMGSRFRGTGMGKPKDDPDEPSDNG